MFEVRNQETKSGKVENLSSNQIINKNSKTQNILNLQKILFKTPQYTDQNSPQLETDDSIAIPNNLLINPTDEEPTKKPDKSKSPKASKNPLKPAEKGIKVTETQLPTLESKPHQNHLHNSPQFNHNQNPLEDCSKTLYCKSKERFNQDSHMVDPAAKNALVNDILPEGPNFKASNNTLLSPHNDDVIPEERTVCSDIESATSQRNNSDQEDQENSEDDKDAQIVKIQQEFYLLPKQLEKDAEFKLNQGNRGFVSQKGVLQTIQISPQETGNG